MRTSDGGGERGYDAQMEITSRERHLPVDTLGLVLAVVIPGAHLQDHDGVRWVKEKLNERFCRLKVTFGDSAYGRSGFPARVKRKFGWVLKTILLPLGVKGFVVLPKCWIVERMFAWLPPYRRHNKDHETTTASANAFAHIVMIALMAKRLENVGSSISTHIYS